MSTFVWWAWLVINLAGFAYLIRVAWRRGRLMTIGTAILVVGLWWGVVAIIIDRNRE